MRLISLAALVITIAAAGRTGQVSRALPVLEAEACRIEFTPGADDGKWGGRIAVYDASTDETGAVVNLSRRVIEGREHLPPRVRLAQFEACIRRWKFDGRGSFTVALLGGTILEGVWIIEVTKGDRAFRLRVSVPRRNR